ncbi:hypothetical protein niasHT_022352 [Heterodera trifolii]|uniref:Carboxypeptidase n=1 Tax=Heterodera trifolii TaxID=157864 RepID=A0ABD2KNW0_9BILA
MLNPLILAIIIILTTNAKEIGSQLCTKLTSASADEIEALPGLGTAPNFKHYSGYLKSADKHFLHYWFVTSQNDPCRDPLVFWFNGGPGCSSLGGLLEELGPYLVNSDGRTLRLNPHSWNKNASVVFIESPVGVGFSYSADEERVMSGDESTAQGNYEAVKQFFLKFPLFRTNRVFITGESYAGIYVPTLVAKIVDGQADFPINLEGMAIGNGHMHTSMNFDTMARFAYSHGLLAESSWKELENECCRGCILAIWVYCTESATERYGNHLFKWRPNALKVLNIMRFVWRGGLNVYDIYRDCDHQPNSKRMKAIRNGIFKSANKTDRWNTIGEELDAKAGKIGSLSKSDNLKENEIARESLREIKPCAFDDLSPLVLKAIEAKVRVLLYFGDTDIVCNFLHGQRFSAQLGLSTLDEKKPWHFGGQIAGFKTEYARGLTFLTHGLELENNVNTVSTDAELCTKLTSASADEIEALPGLGTAPNFKHYSGYLKSADKHFLHYWFVTSQNDPCRDPLVFWFNGGPGCSSLGGLLEELGPYLVNSDGRTLRLNPHSWNKNASVVFIESPVGVGFSYSADEERVMSGDESTAQGNYEAVKQFFLKFPLFRTNRVFITGESYAGIYVPTLVAKIVDGQADFPINLEGMAIGNGFMNEAIDTDTLARFAYFHGFVGESEWNAIEKHCCGGCADNCNLGEQFGECRAMVRDIILFCWRGGINVYDIYRDCFPQHSKMAAIRRGILRAKAFHSNDTNLWEPLEEINLRGGAPCLDDHAITNYLNTPRVRETLHIPPNVPNWESCNDWVGILYTTEYSDMSPFVRKAINANLRVLLYSGDTDMACNFLSGQHFSAQLGLATIAKKKPWYFRGQIAGFRTEYARNLTFITVRGAGHMVPQWRPAEMEHAFRQFISYKQI